MRFSRFAFLIGLVSCGGAARVNPVLEAPAAVAVPAPSSGPNVVATTPDEAFRQHPPDPGRASAFNVPGAQRLQLKSGVQAYLVPLESNLVAIQIVAAGGESDLPARNVGLLGLMATAMLEATKTRNNSALRLAYRQAGMPSPDIRYGHEGALVSGVSTADHLEAMANALVDVALHPAFDPTLVERSRRQLSADMVDPSPANVADEVLRHVLFGTHPYGSLRQSLAQMRGLKTADVVGLHEKMFTRSRLAIVVAGGVSAAEATNALDDAIVGPPLSAGSSWPPATPLKAPTSARIVVVDRPGVQPAIACGFAGPGAGADDEDSANAALELLVDARMGSLTITLRDRLGYVPWLASYAWTERQAGELGFRTRAPAGQVAAVLTEVSKAFGSTAPLDADVVAWRERASFAVTSTFVSAQGASKLYANVLLQHRPIESLSTILDRSQAVTPATVQQAASKWLDPSKMRTVIVGDWAALRGPLTELGWGPVELRDADGELVRNTGASH